MGKEIDSFLSNECMKVITDLSIKHPNDMSFGKAVRSFIQNTKQPIIKRPSNQQGPIDMGDVDDN